MKECAKEKEYKGATIEVTQNPTGVSICIMDAFTGDVLDEYQNLTLTVENAFTKAKAVIDGYLPDGQLQGNLSQGFAYVRYIS